MISNWDSHVEYPFWDFIFKKVFFFFFLITEKMVIFYIFPEKLGTKLIIYLYVFCVCLILIFFFRTGLKIGPFILKFLKIRYQREKRKIRFHSIELYVVP